MSEIKLKPTATIISSPISDFTSKSAFASPTRGGGYSPARPFSGFQGLLSPKLMSSYHVNSFDQGNQAVQRLKERLEAYVRGADKPHQIKEVFYNCLTEMLNKVALTQDKKLQLKQIEDVEKWFNNNVDAVEYRTIDRSKVDSLSGAPSTRPSTNQTTPRVQTASHSLSSSQRFSQTDYKGSTTYGQPFLSTSQSLVMSPSATISPGKDSQTFWHKRLQPHYDPTCLSSYPVGSPQFKEDVESELLKNSKNKFCKFKVQNGVNQNIIQWSQYKRNLLVQSAFKRELYQESSQFQRLGILSQSKANLFASPLSKTDKQNELQKSIKDINHDLFLRGTEDSIESTDSILEVKPNVTTPKATSVPKAPLKTSEKARRIIDLTKDEDFNQFQLTQELDLSKTVKLATTRPVMNPYAVSLINKKTSYTQNQICNIHTNRLKNLRVNRASFLFYENTGDQAKSNGDNQSVDPNASPSHQQSSGILKDVPSGPKIASYPSVGEDNKNLNTVINDQSETADVISLSCFSRPITRSNPHQPKKASLLSHQALSRMGYNFKLVHKTKENRLKELQEIDNITTELAKTEVYIPKQVLQKAIIYDNEREIPQKFGKTATVNPEEATIKPIQEQAEEFIVKYPGLVEGLLVNPFAVKKEKGKKKKKR